MNRSNLENNFLNAIRTYLSIGQRGIELALAMMEKMPEGAGKNSARGLISKYYLDRDAIGQALVFALQMTPGEEKDVALAGYINGRLDARDPGGSASMYQYLVLMNPGAIRDVVIQKFTECAARTVDVDKVVNAILMVSVDEGRLAWQERYFQNALLAGSPARATKMLATLGRKPRRHERVKLLETCMEYGRLEDFEAACVLCDRSGATNDELGILAEAAAGRVQLNDALSAIKRMLPGPLRTKACWAVVNAFRGLDYHQLEFINAELETVPLMLEEERSKAYAVLMEKCVSMGMMAKGSRVADARGEEFNDTEIERLIAVNRARNNRYDEDDLRLAKNMKDPARKVAVVRQLLAFYIGCGQLTAAQAAAEICGEPLADDQILAVIGKYHYNYQQVVFGLSLLKKKLGQAEMDALLLGETPAR